MKPHKTQDPCAAMPQNATTTTTDKYSLALPASAPDCLKAMAANLDGIERTQAALDARLSQTQLSSQAANPQDDQDQQQLREEVQQEVATLAEHFTTAAQAMDEAQQAIMEHQRASDKMSPRSYLQSAHAWVFRSKIRGGGQQLCKTLNKVIRDKHPEIAPGPDGNVITGVDSIRGNRCRVWFWCASAAQAVHRLGADETDVYWATSALEKEDNWMLKNIKGTIEKHNEQFVEFKGIVFRWVRGRLLVHRGKHSGFYPLSMHKPTVDGMLFVGSDVVGLDDPELIAEAIQVAFAHKQRLLAMPSRPTSPSPSQLPSPSSTVEYEQDATADELEAMMEVMLSKMNAMNESFEKCHVEFQSKLG